MIKARICPSRGFLDLSHSFYWHGTASTLRNVIFEFCKRALLNPKLEAGASLGHERRLTRAAYILVPSWSTSDKPAAIDVSITSPFKSSILSEAGVQQLDLQRRESTHVVISSAPNWVGSVFH